MAGHAFDTVARTLASGLPRRRMVGSLLGLAAGSLAASVRGRASAQPAPDAAQSPPTTYLYVQSAAGGTLTPAKRADHYTLTLAGVGPRTVYFGNIGGSDTGTIPTATFVDELPTLFPGPPNAALSVHVDSGEEETLTFTILSGSHDADARTIQYEIRLLANVESPGLAAFDERGTPVVAPGRFAEAHLFIDDGGISCTCCPLDSTQRQRFGCSTRTVASCTVCRPSLTQNCICGHPPPS